MPVKPQTMPATPSASSGAAEAPVSAAPRERTIRFLKRHNSYNRGDVAGFGMALADELIRQGRAVDVASPAGFVRK